MYGRGGGRDAVMGYLKKKKKKTKNKNEYKPAVSSLKEACYLQFQAG